MCFAAECEDSEVVCNGLKEVKELFHNGTEADIIVFIDIFIRKNRKFLSKAMFFHTQHESMELSISQLTLEHFLHVHVSKCKK